MISIPSSMFGIWFGNPEIVLLVPVAVLLFLLTLRGLRITKRRLILAILRSLAVASMILVIASPYVIKEEKIKEEKVSVIVVNDQSRSMELMDSLEGRVLDALSAYGVDRSSIREVNMSEKNLSAIGNAVYNSVLSSSYEKNAIILLSDGNNNYGSDILDVAGFAAETGSRVFPVVPEVRGEEVYIKGIEGPDNTLEGVEYSGYVDVGAVGKKAEYRLEVFVDGRGILDTPVVQEEKEQRIPFSAVLGKVGFHNITARISAGSGDSFAINNIFNKVVRVEKQPKILFVGENSSMLFQVLVKLYDVDVESFLPPNINDYSAIVIDDKKAEELDEGVLRDFLERGNGMLVVGGNRSYDRGGYYNSQLESLLPVRSRESPKEKEKGVNVVVLIDVSGSTGAAMRGDTKIDVEKAIAIKMIRDVSEYAKVGVAAFNSDSFILQSLTKSKDTSALEEKIKRLRFGGGTYVVVGLKRARDMLRGAQGSKYVVLISDGVTRYPVEAFSEARKMAAEGIVVHTIGVGFDTDEGFMKGLAEKGEGAYFFPSETERVKIVMGGEKKEEKGNPVMIIVNPHHFITEGIEMNASISGFNRVSIRPGAQLLAATNGMDPLLAVWRFGLGRVACLMVDDGSSWGKEVYGGGNSRIISSSVNWIIGDVKRNQKRWMRCQDSRVGESASVTIKTDEDYPSIRIGEEEIRSTKIGENLYYLQFTPREMGFMRIGEDNHCSMAVNYPVEYGEFGADREVLEGLAESSGGKVYEEDEIQKLASDISQFKTSESIGTKRERVGVEAWFALIGLCLFFLDVAYRRIGEIIGQDRGKGKGKKREDLS